MLDRHTGQVRQRAPADDPEPGDVELAEVQPVQHVKQAVFDHQQLRAGIRQDVLQLEPARGGVDRHRDRAHPAATQKQRHELGPVAAQDGDTVAGGNTGPHERTGDTGGGLLHVAIAQMQIAAAEQGRIAELRGARFQQLGQHPHGRGKFLLQIRNRIHRCRPVPFNFRQVPARAKDYRCHP